MGALTDDLGGWIAAAANFQPYSAYVTGIGLLVRAWREVNYGRERSDSIPKTETRFLYDFDLAYRIRRLRFVIRRIDSLCLVEMTGKPAQASESVSELFETLSKTVSEQPRMLRSFERSYDQRLHEALKLLMDARDKLHQRKDNPLTELLGAKLALEGNLLNDVLRGRSFDERFATAKAMMRQPQVLEVVNRVAISLRTYVSQVVINASRLSRAALQSCGGGCH